MRKIIECKAGGLMKMRLNLIEGKPVECTACQALLQEHGFEQSKLDESITAWISGDKSVATSREQSQVEPPQKRIKEKPENSTNKKRKADHDADVKQDRLEEENAIQEYLRSFEPTITLLAPGTHGKKHPYRCNVCKTKAWPDGRVGDLVQRKFNMVTTFLHNHISSSMHQKYLQRAHEIQVDHQQAVPCRGLCVNDEVNAGKLFQHRDLFGMWASMANLEEHAKHTYWHEGNDNAWYVRSLNCKKECDPKNGEEDSSICKECLSLAGPRSVSGPDDFFGLKFRWWELDGFGRRT